MKFIHIACATSLMFAAHTLSAQSLADANRDSILNSQKIVFFGKGQEPDHDSDSVRNLLNQFYYDQFRHSQDPEAPYFMFMSKDSQLAMGIGGTVRMRGYFDWGGAIPSPGFAPILIPETPDPTARRKFGTTPAGTALFFRVIGQNKKLGHYSLYIEANFNGYQARDFHLKKAYAQIRDFTIGYANSTFSDPAAVPATVDAQGPNNKLSATSVLVRWMPRYKNWTFAISAETPSDQIDADDVHTKTVESWVPDAAMFVQYEWDKTSHIRLSGILRTLSYRNMVTESNHNKLGWGLQLSSAAHPWYPVTTYFTASYGNGYGGICGDLQIFKYDLIPDPHTLGSMYAPALFGWNVGLQYNIRHNLFVSASVSQNRILPKGKPDPSTYRYGIFACANIFWNLTPRIQVAAEFDYGVRNDFSGQSRHAKRIGAMCQFSF